MNNTTTMFDESYGDKHSMECLVPVDKEIIIEAINQRSSDKLDQIIKINTTKLTNISIINLMEHIIYDFLCDDNRRETFLWLIGYLHKCFDINLIYMKLVGRLYEENKLEVLMNNQTFFYFSATTADCKKYALTFFGDDARIIKIIDYALAAYPKYPIDFELMHFVVNALTFNTNISFPLFELFVRYGFEVTFMRRIPQWYSSGILEFSQLSIISQKILDINKFQFPTETINELVKITLKKWDRRLLGILLKHNVHLKKIVNNYTFSDEPKEDFARIIGKLGLTVEDYLKIASNF